ncbi:MAG: hypothetical protein Q9182_005041 [Xanthomendoza sp. 2 TL-2023]
MQSSISRRAFASLRVFGYGKAYPPTFCTSSRHLKRPPARSPIVRANERARQQGLAPPPRPGKWPIPILKSRIAKNLCFVRLDDEDCITLEEVVAILDEFDALGLAMAKTKAEQICSEYRIDATTLGYLGSILLNYNDAKYRTVATKLLICAVDGGSLDSAVRLINDAMITGVLNGPGVAAARKRMQESIQEKAMTLNSTGVYLEGMMLEHEGNPSKALQLYQAWSDPRTEFLKKLPSRPIYAPEAGDVCKALARVRAKLGDLEGAEKAIRNAALVYDDPSAYYHLAIDFTVPGSPEFEGYLLKAASSDEPKASHELGIFYFDRSRQGISLDTPDWRTSVSHKNPSNVICTISTPSARQQSQAVTLEQRAEAMEWFNIAAESGITASQVYLALLLREAGRADEGLEWLQSATRSADAQVWAEAVAYFKGMWRLSSPDPMRLDIESLRQSSTDAKKKSISRLAGLEDVTLLTNSYHTLHKVNGGWKMDLAPFQKQEARYAASLR